MRAPLNESRRRDPFNIRLQPQPHELELFGLTERARSFGAREEA